MYTIVLVHILALCVVYSYGLCLVINIASTFPEVLAEAMGHRCVAV